MSEGTVRLERHGRIAHVVLNRPETLNAINPTMIKDLKEVWTEVGEDSEIRVAILRGEGRAFSSGADLSPRARTGVHSHRPVSADRQGILNGLLGVGLMAWELPKPVIAQIHGYCYAGGTVIASLTDMIVLAEDTVVGWPRVPVGGGFISPIWSWFVGPYLAKEFSMTVGRSFSGKEAVQMGWGNRAVPAAELEAVTTKMANDIAKLPADILALKKAAINSQMESMGFTNGIKRGAEFDAIVHTSPGIAYAREKIGELGISGAIKWFHDDDGIPDLP